MHVMTAVGSEEAFPQPRFPATVYHAFVVEAREFGRPQLNMVPDSGMKPAAIGSEAHA
jgi:hypothetical protein